ncbi:thiamine diphosphokinase [Caldithrix abyssi]
MKKIVTLILNGEGLETQRLKRALEWASVIIAADGGANYCRQQNLQPHYIIGDLDSINQEWKDQFKNSKMMYIADQYSTDLEKALTLAESLQPRQLRVLNATGRRGDHTIANLLFLAQFNKKFKVEVIDNFGRLTFLEAGVHRLNLPLGQTVSFLSFGAVKNLTLAGFQYPLQKETFDDFFVGMSNVTQESPCVVSFDSGTLIMYEVERFE